MFEWDETKRQKNLEKHRLDFRETRLIYDGRKALHIPALKNEEARYIFYCHNRREILHSRLDVAGR